MSALSPHLQGLLKFLVAISPLLVYFFTYYLLLNSFVRKHITAESLSRVKKSLFNSALGNFAIFPFIVFIFFAVHFAGSRSHFHPINIFMLGGIAFHFTVLFLAPSDSVGTSVLLWFASALTTNITLVNILLNPLKKYVGFTKAMLLHVSIWAITFGYCLLIHVAANRFFVS